MRYLLTISTALLFLFSPALAQQEASPPSAGSATFEGLGDLVGGNFESRAYGVSPDGVAVVGSSQSAEGTQAFRWESGTMEGLGDLPSDRFGSVAYDVSVNGTVVVGAGNFGWPPEGTEAFRWENGVMDGLGDFPGDPFWSEAYGVSADGNVVVGLSTLSYAQWEAFRWTVQADSMEGLSGGAADSYVTDVSGKGSVAVGLAVLENVEAFRWENGEMAGLGHLSGDYTQSRALGVSADGSVVVGYSNADYLRSKAFRWEEGVMEDLGRLAESDTIIAAEASSFDGSVVVGYSGVHSSKLAFLWTEEDGMQNLKEILEIEYGLDLTGWTLRSATDISDDGSVIVGTGTNPEGNTEAWRAAGLFPVATDPEAPNQEALALVNYPNPANASTKLTFSLNEPEEVTLEVYDTLGRLMSHVTREVLAGANEVKLSTASWPAGTYIARVRAGDSEEQHRFTVIH